MAAAADSRRISGDRDDSRSWPPGFRFHPTDEELVLYYLKRKVFRRRIRLPMIGDVDVYKYEPWELPERSRLRSGDKQWFFFSPRDRKYPNGSRSNRTTRCGYWKATGKDRTISQGSRAVGNKKTLVYYQGRAPKGQRTDWVMHEYVLEDHVLVNSNNAQDWYALYKLFRKSGPGPKNGEQYGAPFKEEEWNEDEGTSFRDLDNNRVEEVSENVQGDSISTTTMLGDGADAELVYDLEDFLLQMPDELVATTERQVEAGADVGPSTIGLSYFDDVSYQRGGQCVQGIVDMNFQLLQTASAVAQPIEMPEVTSITNCSEQAILENSEKFLEIKDFIDPDCPALDMNDMRQKHHTEVVGEFFDPYDYFDADMFLAEAMGPLDGTVPPTSFHGFNDFEDAQSQASNIVNELWTYDQSYNVPTVVESKQTFISPQASGTVCENNPPNAGVNYMGQINNTGSASDSWFNSAISSLLDSIPNRPAMASENALINRALERVSSFKGGQIGNLAPNSRTGAAALGRRQGGQNGGFLFVSFFVGVCAVFWLLAIGAALKVLKGIWSRFVT